MPIPAIHFSVRNAAQSVSLIGALACWLVSPCWAGTISSVALSKSGEPMPDVVVFAMPVDHPAPPAVKVEAPIIAQQNMQFTPYVTAVRVGTEVKFPNYDKIEHHVKSFSPAKEFEIKPYQKVTPPPILFDKSGIIVVYCLFHEWMRAYVMVVDTPYFAKTDASGAVNLDNLPDGKYEIRAWHPDMGYIKPPLTQTISVAGAGTQQIKFNFDFVPKKRKFAKTESTTEVKPDSK
jgi:plastocyanin